MFQINSSHKIEMLPHSVKFHLLLRTKDRHSWYDTVCQLVSMAPIVVVDVRSPFSDAILHEASLMLLPENVRKGIVVGDPEERYPLLNELHSPLVADAVFVPETQLDAVLTTLLQGKQPRERQEFLFAPRKIDCMRR